MKLHPRVTRSGLELVKRFEGLRRRAARLPDGGWTIGYGHTRAAREGAVVSPEDADALLHYDLSEVAEKVEAWTFTPLNQNQFEALTAFAFNIGIDNFRRSTVLKRVNEGQHLMAAAALELWRKSDFGGEDLVIDALVRRRAAEKAHYLTPPEGFRPSPSQVVRPSFDHSVIEAAANARAARAAVMVDAPLEGDRATATMQDQASDSALSSEADSVGAMTGRLHQLFPQKTDEPASDEPAPPPPFALEGQPAVMEDAPFGRFDEAGPVTELLPLLDVPPPPIQSASAPEGFAGFTPPPVRQLEPSAAASVAGTVERAPLFDSPSPRGPFQSYGDDGSVFSTVAAAAATEGRKNDHNDAAQMLAGHEPGPSRDRSLIYFFVGLVGVAFFSAALFSMFNGKASPVNLVVGLMGILLMTPAGGYFLLRLLNDRDLLVEL